MMTPTDAQLRTLLGLYTGPAVVMVPGDDMRAIVGELLALRASDAERQAQGWIICPPDHVPLPRSVKEAGRMHLLAKHYLEARKHDRRDDA